MKQLEIIFSLLFTASLASTVILLIVLLIRKLFHKQLNPKVIHLLWCVALIKLLVPIAPQSAISLFNVLPEAMPVEWNSELSNRLPYPSEVQNQTLGITPTHIDEPDSTVVTRTSQEPLLKSDNGTTWLTIGSMVWLGGLLILGGYYLFSTLIFKAKVRNARKLEDDKVLSVLAACKEKLNIRGQVHAYETKHLRSPCLYGLWKPKIYLPEDIIMITDSNQLTHILMHELTHYKRKDLWFNALWILAVGMHWYNPVVWLTMRKIKADQEVACDASVLEALGEREASSYGKTLLMLSQLFSRDASSPINLSHFGNNKNETKRRITMITEFKKGSYKLSAAAIVLLLALSAVLLTNSTDDAKEDTITGNVTQVASPKGKLPSYYDDGFSWFNSLDRALDFPKFNFKVPDYLPEGYQFSGVLYYKNFTGPNDVDLIDVASITFVSDFGGTNENTIEVSAAIGNGSLLEHQQLRGAPQALNETPEYRQETITIGSVTGTLFTDKRLYKSRPETGKSFYWQDGAVWYAINYYSEYMTQEEMARIVQSFVAPKEVQHVRYDGEGNSFPLYDEKDLLAAKQILGTDLKLPFQLNDTEVALRNLTMLKGEDQNTGYSFRQTEDALWSAYAAPYDSKIHDLNSSLELYQSKAPLFDTTKLSLTHQLEMNGITISAYADKDHIYFEPRDSADSSKLLSLTYYIWNQDNIYFTAVFSGMDQYQEESLKALVMAPLE